MSIVSLVNCHFLSTTPGSENVNIESSSLLRGIGTDLSEDATYPFNYDGLNNNRPADDWDVGAIQYVSGGIPPVTTYEKGIFFSNSPNKKIIFFKKGI